MDACALAWATRCAPRVPAPCYHRFVRIVPWLVAAAVAGGASLAALDDAYA